ncbi:MAG: restriction endonuclease subunit S [Pseudomonadota bacterium]
MSDGWRNAKLGSFMEFKNGLNADKDAYGHGLKFVNVMDIFRSSELYAEDIIGSVQTSSKAASEYSVKYGDILFNRTSETPEDIACASVYLDDEAITFGGFVIRGRQTEKVLDPEFCRYVFQTHDVRRETVRRCQGAVRANIGQQDLAQVALRIPPLPEQRKIAEILRTWDEALEKLTALRAAKERRLGALRAALLFGSLRPKGLRHNWAPTRLEAVTHELTKRNGAKGLGRDSVMGVTKAEGVVPMREQTIAADIIRYKRLPPRAFAYNPMRINVGSIAMNERDEAVLVSPDYVVFACNADGLDPDYLDHLRKTSWWAHYINSGGSGSVRQRTYYADLAALKLPLPDLDEQKAIAAVLNTAREDLAATEREIEAVTLQKRGLMQKLLTGEWRVATTEKDSTEAAE